MFNYGDDRWVNKLSAGKIENIRFISYYLNPQRNKLTVILCLCTRLLYKHGMKLFELDCKVNICHGRKSNLVEFQILPVESPIGVSTSRKSNSTNINLVESPLGVSTGRKS